MVLMLQSSARQTKEQLRLFRDTGRFTSFYPDVDDFAANEELLQAVPNLEINLLEGGGADVLRGVSVKQSLPSAVFRNEFRYVTSGEIFGSSVNSIIQARYQQAQSYNASISSGSSASGGGRSSLAGTHWVMPSGAVVSWEGGLIAGPVGQ